jgi:hypothetical protein
MRPMQKSPGCLKFSAGAFLHKAVAIMRSLIAENQES